jgi:hypothetical protein
MVAEMQDETKKVLGTILWEIDFNKGFAQSVIPNSFNIAKMPFLDIRHSDIKGDLRLFQYYRYKSNPHPILAGINKNELFLTEIEMVNAVKN